MALPRNRSNRRRQSPTPPSQGNDNSLPLPFLDDSNDSTTPSNHADDHPPLPIPEPARNENRESDGNRNQDQNHRVNQNQHGSNSNIDSSFTSHRIHHTKSTDDHGLRNSVTSPSTSNARNRNTAQGANRNEQAQQTNGSRDDRERYVLNLFKSGRLETRRYNALRDMMRPLAPAHRPFHYPGWNGEGYPKGLGHGPIVWRYDNKKDKMVKIEGLSYESLRSPGHPGEKSSWQKILDEDPYDAAGQLRIFRRGTSGTMIISEWDSDQAAVMERASMESRASSMHDPNVDLSWHKRPRLDSRDGDDKMMFPIDDRGHLINPKSA